MSWTPDGVGFDSSGSTGSASGSVLLHIKLVFEFAGVFAGAEPFLVFLFPRWLGHLLGIMEKVSWKCEGTETIMGTIDAIPRDQNVHKLASARACAIVAAVLFPTLSISLTCQPGTFQPSRISSSPDVSCQPRAE